MRSAINRVVRTAVSATAKSATTTTSWANIRSKSFVSHPRIIDQNQSIWGKIGEIRVRVRVRSSSQLVRIWDHHQNRNYSMKHQEIEGPTVERDMSEVAKESREVTESTMKSMYDVSKSMAALALVQLTLGGYMAWNSPIPIGNDVLRMSVSAVAFGFPISMALMMRQSLKTMQFFDKMEKLGRLQLMTSTMQIMKQIRVFWVRVRVVAYTSVSGLVFSLLYSISAPHFSSAA